jgi:phosphoribosylformimino-5-aminoimidazole carboxamide ribotide isomerase
VLYTDISRDGTGKGVNVDATADLAARVRIPVIASGGVRDLADLDRLAEHPGIEGVVVGRALYEGQIDVAEACRRHQTSTLLPD